MRILLISAIAITLLSTAGGEALAKRGMPGAQRFFRNDGTANMAVQACGSDARAYCANVIRQPAARRQCMMSNFARLQPQCQAFMNAQGAGR